MAPLAVAGSDHEIVVGDIVIRTGSGANEDQLTGGDTRGTGCSIVMLGHGGLVKAFVATPPVDFRKGIDGFALAV